VIRSITPASVRCEECGAEAGDPSCYTRDDEPTGYHAARRKAAEVVRLTRREQARQARAKRAAERSTEQALRARLAELERDNRNLRAALSAIADVVTVANRPAGTGEEER
jgi:hypothetical protein